VFMHIPADKPEEYYDRWLGDTGHAVWLACRDDAPVAYMQLCRLDEEVVVTDERTAGIEGAFTQPALRGSGIGTALLGRCLEWAREQGFERCAVDFEGENVLGRRFWLRHFEPVLYSLARRIDPRAVVERTNQSRHLETRGKDMHFAPPPPS
jgi:GNAT superfamily N-acetyltransferase